MPYSFTIIRLPVLYIQYILSVPCWVAEQTVAAVVTSRLDEQKLKQEKLTAVDLRIKHVRDPSSDAHKVDILFNLNYNTLCTLIMMFTAVQG